MNIYEPNLSLVLEKPVIICDSPNPGRKKLTLFGSKRKEMAKSDCSIWVGPPTPDEIDETENL